MPPLQQRALVFVYLQGLGVLGAAQRLDLSPSTVGRQVRLGLQRLAVLMGETDND